MPKSMRMPKTPVKTKTAAVRHDEHSDPPRPSVDPACPICQVDIGTKSPDGVREGYAVTPCGHVFGSVCIKQYLALTADKPLCPVCRTDLYHACAHPVLPAGYDPTHSRLSREEAAAKAFPHDHRNVDCAFCLHRRAKAARHMRKRDLLERITRTGRSGVVGSSRGSGGGSSAYTASATASGSGSATASGQEEEEEEEEYSDHETSGVGGSSGRTRMLRWAIHIVHSTSALARLTLVKIRIRKHGVPGEQESSLSGSSSSSRNSEQYDEEEEEREYHYEEEYNENAELTGDGEGEGDIILPDIPQLTATRPSFPPVPGSYGHWDLANKGPDWKFLGWYDSQEPKTRTTPEQFS